MFVCLGNICRSPTAQAVFAARAAYAGLDVTVDSAGTGGWHEGQPPDIRTQEHGRQRGYVFTNMRARAFTDEDFTWFDYILAMDEKNLDVLKSRRPDDYNGHIGLLMDFARDLDVKEVPDPYYSGASGFVRVLDLIETACSGLIAHIKAQSAKPSQVS